MVSSVEPTSSSPQLYGKVQRPAGISVLVVFAALLGFALLAALIAMAFNWFWGIPILTSVLAFAASAGMWQRQKWGWWLACSGLIVCVIDNFGRGAENLSRGASPSSVDVLKFLVRGGLCVAVLGYWLRTPVREYFEVARVGRVKAIVIAGASGIGFLAVFSIGLLAVVRYVMR